jgi:hypothetical protein
MDFAVHVEVGVRQPTPGGTSARVGDEAPALCGRLSSSASSAAGITTDLCGGCEGAGMLTADRQQRCGFSIIRQPLLRKSL